MVGFVRTEGKTLLMKVKGCGFIATIYLRKCTVLKWRAVSTADARQSVFGELKYSEGYTSCSFVQIGSEQIFLYTTELKRG